MKFYHPSFLFAYTHYSPTKFCPKKRRLGFGPLGTRIITLYVLLRCSPVIVRVHNAEELLLEAELDVHEAG